jgi:predicted nucleic acid-binding protein
LPLLVDTGALFALADADDAAHARVRDFIGTVSEELVVPVTILPEIDYLVVSRLGVHVEIALLRAISSGDFRVEQLGNGDLQRSLELIEQYAESRIGLVDASLVAIAERLRISRILTLDHRHFRMFRPRHCEVFDLLP